MKIYIAAPYPIRQVAMGVMVSLESHGHKVTSRWLKAPDKLTDAYAREDLADIDAADMLLAINTHDFENAGTGGRHVEFGYAIAKEKHLALIGKRSNIFHHLSNVRVYETLEAFLAMVAHTRA